PHRSGTCHNGQLNCSFTRCPLDGGFAPWSLWTPCSVSCGGLGHMTRARGCTNPPPANGGKDCVGLRTDIKYCQTCAGRNCTWTPWAPWSECSRSCGVGQQRRLRTYHPPGERGLWCQGILTTNTERRFCNLQACKGRATGAGDLASLPQAGCLTQGHTGFSPVPGAWSKWSPWSWCDRTCGGGRSVACINPPPRNNGSYCAGPEAEAQGCTARPCPGEWCPPGLGGGPEPVPLLTLCPLPQRRSHVTGRPGAPAHAPVAPGWPRGRGHAPAPAPRGPAPPAMTVPARRWSPATCGPVKVGAAPGDGRAAPEPACAQPAVVLPSGLLGTGCPA
uniref:Uncharacterized protein n=1 Tax=Chelonoidis abingdonii TaxID=106734 RepID=A0A8C0GWN8_CHEAB